MKQYATLFAALVILLSGGAVFFAVSGTLEHEDAALSVNDFDSCVAAGNPVMESYPRQCKSTDGRTFVEEVVEPPPHPEAEIPGGATVPEEFRDLIVISSPEDGAVVRSPLVVSGEARGMWYFEASFPVAVVDESGKVLAEVPAQAEGEWMTEEFVPFSATLSWEAGATTATSGFVVFKKDNPSGLPEHDASVRVPVFFEQ